MNTTQSTRTVKQPSFLQQKRHAGMGKYTDTDDLNENEYCRFIESYIDEDGRYVLSSKQKKRLDKSRQDIAAGLGISHEVVMSEIDKWLSEE